MTLEKICSECGSNEFYTDKSTQDIICLTCGIVEEHSRPSKDKRSFFDKILLKNIKIEKPAKPQKPKKQEHSGLMVSKDRSFPETIKPKPKLKLKELDSSDLMKSADGGLFFRQHSAEFYNQFAPEILSFFENETELSTAKIFEKLKSYLRQDKYLAKQKINSLKTKVRSLLVELSEIDNILDRIYVNDFYFTYSLNTDFSYLLAKH